jgi:hypothetical protein
MSSRDPRDIIGGCLLAAIGLFFAVYSLANYQLGAMSQMGPGMLPLQLGVILVLLGLAIAGMGLMRAGALPRPDMRALLAVTGAIIGFAVVADLMGLIPAVIAVVVASALADNKLSPVAIAGLTAVLLVIAVVAFHYGLGIRMPLFRWPL